MEDVEDDEGEHGESGPNHDGGGFAGSLGCFMSVSGAGCFILSHQGNGGDDVQDQRGEQNEAGNPNNGAMAQMME